MEELIYTKINEYDSELKDFEISFSNRSLALDDLIVSYKGRYKMATKKNMKELIFSILTNLYLIRETSVNYVKFVVVRKDSISRLFFFSEDYSEIFFDFQFPENKE
ncbi:hypothetical protein [Chryseobacterium sp.]|uniref:hypothetical protein n=1 Tax=Chryseobacterium sp. TaxID=1871047 RepID=UPI00289C9598|nr:hypothetical protein [Chryseobacterium sp.]